MELSKVAKPEQPSRPQRRLKVFTLEHANSTLPLVSRIVSDIVRQHKKVCLLEEKYQVPGPRGSEEDRKALGRRYAAELDVLCELRDELSAIGCQLKDWRRGLVDFLGRHQGRPIEFCWRLGEARIQHWHEADAGFRARQPIDEEFLAESLAAPLQTRATESAAPD